MAGKPSNNRHTPANFEERFWAKVRKGGPDECWLWQGGKVRTGRGQVHLRWDGTKNVRRFASVMAWVLTHGEIRTGQKVLHKCDVPQCCNPNHLFLGTQATNIHDSIQKGRYNCFGRQKLNAEQVRRIRARAATGERHADIAKDFSIARHTVSGIANRTSWAHLTDHPALDAVFARVEHVDLPVVGELDLSGSHHGR